MSEAAQGYGNVSEYFRSLLREAQQAEEDARLETLLLEGLARGADIPLTPAFWKELWSSRMRPTQRSGSWTRSRNRSSSFCACRAWALRRRCATARESWSVSVPRMTRSESVGDALCDRRGI